MTTIKREKHVPYSAAQMFDLVNDIRSYPLFLPWCKESTVHKETEDEVHASLVITGAGLSKTFSTLNRLQKHKMIEIRLVDGPFKHLEGYWRFENSKQGGSEVIFDLEFEFAGGLLSFAFGPIFQQMAGSLVQAFSERAELIYGQTQTENS